jgi:hypothetical protein
MGRIPIEYAQPAQQTGTTGVRVNPGLYDAQFAAQRQIGQGIGALGEAAASVAQAAERVQASYDDALMRKVSGDFDVLAFNQATAAKSRNKDFKQIVPDFETAADTFIAKNISRDLSRTAQEKLKASLMQKKAIGAAELGAVQTAKIAQESVNLNLLSAEQAAKSGDISTGLLILSRMESAGDLSESKTEEYRAKFSSISDYSLATQSMADRNAASEVFNDPERFSSTYSSLNEGDRLSLVAKLKQLQHQDRVDTAENISSQIALYDTSQDPNRRWPFSQKFLDNLLFEKRITSSQHHLLSEQNAIKVRLNPEEKRAKFDEVLSSINTYNPLEDANRAQFANIELEIGFLGGEMAKTLRSAFDEVRKEYGVSHPISRSLQDVQELYQKGVFGLFKTTEIDAKTGPHEVINHPARVQAAAFRDAVISKLRAFIKLNPKATESQIGEKRESLICEVTAQIEQKKYSPQEIGNPAANPPSKK